MIRIIFKEPDSALWKRWIKDCNNATTELKKAYKPNEPFEVSDIYRRKSIKKEVYLEKTGPFRGRCVYCESNVADFQHGDIEHFRPKKAVTDADDNPVVVGTSSDGGKIYHPGYYWLAYNWMNLLLSCITCNQPGDEGIGKRNRFPVEENRYATTEEEIDAEKPLLFNPIDPKDDNPEEHLGIDFDTGEMKNIKPDSQRADACIKIFGLNKRDQLVQERRAAMNEVKSKWTELLYASDAKVPEILEELKKIKQGHYSQTLARRAVLKVLKERFKSLIFEDL